MLFRSVATLRVPVIAIGIDDELIELPFALAGDIYEDFYIVVAPHLAIVMPAVLGLQSGFLRLPGERWHRTITT